MPHIRMVFAEDPEIRALIRLHGPRILEIVADELGYERKDVAVIPEAISAGNAELAVNLLQLEVVIDCGSRAAKNAQTHVDKITDKIAKIRKGFGSLEFGVWLRPMPGSVFASHNIE